MQTRFRNFITTSQQNNWFLPFCFLLLFTIFLSMGWVGFTASDDDSYKGAARVWLDPAVNNIGNTHWSLRHTVTLPIAASISLFGDNEFSLILPSLLSLSLLLCVVFYCVRLKLGRSYAFTAVIGVVLLPIVVVEYTRVVAEIAEITYLVSSLFILIFTHNTRFQARGAILAGLALGLAAITRETAVQLAVILCVLMIKPVWITRKSVIICGLIAATFVATEMLWYSVELGDPLHRLNVDMNHGDIGGGVDRFTDRGTGTLSREGNIQVHWAMDPLLVIFVNEEFGLFFWLGLALGYLAVFKQHLFDKAVLKYIRALLAISALSFFVVSSAIPFLNLLPRYYMFSAIINAIAIALATPSLFRHAPARTSLLALLTIAISVVALTIENKNPIALERALVAHLAANPDISIVNSPPTLANNMITLSKWHKVASNRISVSKKPPVDRGSTTKQIYTVHILSAEAGYDKRARAAEIERRFGKQSVTLVDPGQPWLAGVLIYIPYIERLSLDLKKRLLSPNSIAVLLPETAPQ